MIAAKTLTEGTPAPILSEREFGTLRDLLYERAGLYFADSKKLFLEARVRKRLSAMGLDSASAYLSLVRSPGSGSRELLELLDVVTTHETSFFRNRPQLEAFQKAVLPEVLRAQEQKGRRTLRIWSAGCSSGEEPYTLAMIVLEVLGAEVSRWAIRILGTDIAQSSLEQARKGVYYRYSFRNAPAYHVQKYFEPEGPDTFRLKPEPKRLVEFDRLNFADSARMGRMKGFQIVLCRNALIYFDKPTKRRFVAHFARALEAGGYFFVGHAESLHGISNEFKLIHFPGAMAYRKPVCGEGGQTHEYAGVA